MKITKITKLTNVILTLIFFVLVFYFNFRPIWFSLSLIFLSISQLLFAIFLKLDSKLYLFSILFFCGAFGIIKYYFSLPLSYYYFVYILILGLASLLVFAFFRQKFHLKVFVICALEVLLLVVYKMDFVTILEFSVLEIAFLLFIIQSISNRVHVNTRSNWLWTLHQVKTATTKKK